MRQTEGAGEAGNRRVGTAHPGRAHEPHPGHREPGHDVGIAVVGRRHERDAEMLREPERRRIERRGGLADGDPVELPHRGPALRIDGGDAIPDEEIVVGEVHHVAEDVLVGAGGVEHGIAVEVFGVEHAVALCAPAAQVSPWEEWHRIGENAVAERDPGHRPLPHFLDLIGTVAEDTDVVHVGVEDADLGALGVEAAGADVLAPRKDGVGAVHHEAVGRDREGVFAHGTKIEYQAQAGGIGGTADRLKHPELEKVVAAQVEAGGAEVVTIERHRGRKSRRGRDHREELFRCTMPPAVSAWSVR